MPHRVPVHRHDQRALLVALVLIVIWGGNFTLQKYLFDLITPGGFLWARYLIMPLCALVLMRWRFGVWLPPLPRKDWQHMAWLGFIGHSLHVGLVTYGIHWSTAFSSSVILACGPIFTLLILRMQGLEQASDVEVSLAASAVAKAKAQIDLYQFQISQCSIRAPWSGSTAKLHVRSHMTVSAGQPLLDLVRSGLLLLKLNVPSNWMSTLKMGHEFEVTIDETGNTYAARVHRINSRVDPVSQTIELEATMLKSHADLLPGMSGVAKFTGMR